MSNEELNDYSSDTSSKMVDDVSSTKSDKVTSSAMERRKISKPVMEKRRRARINASLTELKTFLLDIIKKEGFRQNKMEKADILELTVKHLRHLQRQQHSVPTAPIQTEESGGNTFRLGFSECASEVNKFLSGLPNLEPDVHAKLLDHLSRCITVSKDTGYSVNTSAAQSTASTKSMNYLMQRSIHQSSANHVPIISSIGSCSEGSIVRQELFTQQDSDIPLKDIASYPDPYDDKNQRNSLVSEVCKNQALPIQLIDNLNTDKLKSEVRRPNQVMQSIPLTTNQSPAISVGNMINGLQLVPIQFQNGDIAYAIPTNILSSAVIPNCVLVSPNSQSTTVIATSPKSPSPINREHKVLQHVNNNDSHFDLLSARNEVQNIDRPNVSYEGQHSERSIPVISGSVDSSSVPFISRSLDAVRTPVIPRALDITGMPVIPRSLDSRSVVVPVISRSLDNARVPAIPRSLESRSSVASVISRSLDNDSVHLLSHSLESRSANASVMSRSLDSRSAVAPVISRSLDSRSAVAPVISRSLDSANNNVNNILPQRGDDTDDVWRPW